MSTPPVALRIVSTRVLVELVESDLACNLNEPIVVIVPPVLRKYAAGNIVLNALVRAVCVLVVQPALLVMYTTSLPVAAVPPGHLWSRVNVDTGPLYVASCSTRPARGCPAVLVVVPT
jgi:hypothetical protein